jgi:hypothetical protein
VGDTLKALAEPLSSGERIKTAIDRAARLAGLSYTRAWDIWYGKARRIEDAEAEAIAYALKQKNIEDACNELAQIRLRIARLESILVLSNEEFARQNSSAFQQRVCRSR